MTTAVTLIGGAKEAALYFDYVVPVSHAAFGRVVEATPDIVRGEWSFDDLPHAGVLELFPPELRTISNPWEIVQTLRGYVGVAAEAAGGWTAALVQPRLAEAVLRDNADIDEQALGRASARPFPLPHLPSLRKALEENVKWVRHLAQLDRRGELAFFHGARPSEGVECPGLTLAGLELVDADSISWYQIRMLREDTERAAKLRRLRQFFTKDLRGMPATQIRDELEQRVEGYAEAAKYLGLPLYQAVWQAMWGKDSIYAAAAGALAGATIFSAAIVGAVAALGGRVLFELGKKYLDNQGLAKTNAVAHLVELRKLEAGK